MTDLVGILVGLALVNDLVLPGFLGNCPFRSAAAEPRTILGLSLVMGCTLALAALLTWAVDAWLLRPFGHAELRLLVATGCRGARPAVDTEACSMPTQLRQALRPWPDHLTVNCALLAGALVSTGKFSTPGAGLAWGLGAGLAFGLAMILYAELRQRLAMGDVPRPFRGAAIALVTGGMLSLAINGLAGDATTHKLPAAPTWTAPTGADVILNPTCTSSAYAEPSTSTPVDFGAIQLSDAGGHTQSRWQIDASPYDWATPSLHRISSTDLVSSESWAINLTASTEYKGRVRHYNSAGLGTWSSEVTFTTRTTGGGGPGSQGLPTWSGSFTGSF